MDLPTHPLEAIVPGRPIRMRLVCTFLMSFALTSSLSYGKALNIAVNDLVGQGVDSTTTAVISERIRAELTGTNGFRVMERSQMEAILREQNFQQSGCTGNSCAVEIGQLLGVDHLVMGSIGMVGRSYTLTLRMVNAGTGEVVQTVSEDCRCPIEDVLAVAARNVASKLDEAVQKADFGAVSIKSVPEGAVVLFDGKEGGKTNYFEDRFIPGTVAMRLELPDYNPVEQTIVVTARKKLELNITLERTKAYLDSAARVEHRVHTKHLWIRQAILGSVTLGLAGAGYYFNTRVADAAKERDAAYATYRTTGEGGDHASLWTRYQDAGSDLESDQTVRDVLYACSGVMAAAFAISFAF